MKQRTKRKITEDIAGSDVPATKNAKKMPNIAQELAMNRNNVKVSSVSPTLIALTPSIAKSTSPITNNTSNGTPSKSTTEYVTKEVKPKARSKPRAKPKPKTDTKNPPPTTLTSTTKTSTTIGSPIIVEPQNSKMKQVKIASLLSTNDDSKSNSEAATPIKSTTAPVQSILPKPSPSTTVKKSKSSANVTAEPVKSSLATTIASSAPSASTATINKNNTNTTTNKKLNSKPALKRSKSNASSSTSTSTSMSIKKSSTTGSTATKASKSKSTTAIDSGATKKKPTTKKTNETEKKKSTDNTNISNPEPSKLVPPRTINAPDLLSSISKPNPSKDKNSKISIVNIPLYPTTSNEYLDENGTVTFNLFKLLKEKEGKKLNSKDEMMLKRKSLFTEELKLNSGTELSTDVDDEEIILDADDDIEGMEDGDTKSEVPKKKSHPMKGKNLIGKYDFEDPFIDDSELLWEEQRASTKDGFFVFFGPLIGKGQSVSFERANGTMKRGGIKK